MSSVDVISHNSLLSRSKTFAESQTCHSSEILKDRPTVFEIVGLIRGMTLPVKRFEILRSRSSDSGKSSSCSPMPLDSSDDTNTTSTKLNTDDMVLSKRIQQCAFILLSLERGRENFHSIRNRLR